MKRTRTTSDLVTLIELLDESYQRHAWHGPNLRGAIRGISSRQATWRPGRKRHNIWEIVVHCAYWKYIVRRRILGEKKGSFPLRGSNWFPRPATVSEKAWRDDMRLLNDMHDRMMEAIRSLSTRDLKKIPTGSRVSNEAILRGIASHDVYHAGQIQLLKKLMR